MTVWFTSDQHFSHANIINLSGRPFRNVAEMNAAMIDRWNDRVGDDDTVWVLGDVAMGKIAESLPLVAQLRGHKKLVAGNHDRCFSGERDRRGRWIAAYLDAGFDMICEHAYLRIEDVPVELSHFPYAGDSHDTDRYAGHRPTDRGGWLLHGHVHERWRQRDRQINVGVDVWDYAPVSAATIADLIRSETAGPAG